MRIESTQVVKHSQHPSFFRETGDIRSHHPQTEGIKEEKRGYAYQKCLKDSSFLGRWPLEQKEVHVFLSPLEILEAFVVREQSSQQWEIEEYFPKDHIRGGINGSISSFTLCSALQRDAHSFALAITGAAESRILTFLPRLEGGVGSASAEPPINDGENVQLTDRETSQERHDLTGEEDKSLEARSKRISIIQAKLSNVLRDSEYLGKEEFNLSIKSAKKITGEHVSEIPWREFITACHCLVRAKIRKKEFQTALTCTKKLTKLFLKAIPHLEEESPLLRQEFLQLFTHLRSFFEEGSSQDEGQRENRSNQIEHLTCKRDYLSWALKIAESPIDQFALLLEGGDLSLALAEIKREEEIAGAEPTRKDKKTASFTEYERAASYFVAAYRVAEKHPQLREQKTGAFAKLCGVQGSHLSGHIPEENSEEVFTKYIDAYAEKCAPFCLKKLSPPEITRLIKQRENAAEYVAACGSFKLAYRLYKVLYERFEKVKGVDADKYLQLTTQLGTSEEGVKAREHFLQKIENLQKELGSIRELAFSLQTDKGITLANQKIVDERYRAFITELFETCNLILDPQGAHPYALLAVGSLARREMCPYSDFEVALLLEKETDQAHFRKVAELFHLLILSLGETQDDLVKEKSFLPKGFSLDASNNLFHLCGLPKVLAQRQAKIEEPVQLNVLRSVSFLSGKKELLEQYHLELQGVLSLEDGSWRKTHALSGIQNAIDIAKTALTNSTTLHIKNDLLRFCVFAFESLCLYYGIDTSCHTIEKVEALCREGYFPRVLQAPFQDYLEFAFGLRWKSHLAAQEEQDAYTLDPLEKETILIAHQTLLQPLKDTLINCLGDGKALQDATFFAIAHFEQAEKLLQKKNFPVALTYLEKAVALKEDPLYLKLYGQLAFCLGYFTQAKDAWQKNHQLLKEELSSFKEEVPLSIYGTWKEFPFVDKKKVTKEITLTPFEECSEEENLFRNLVHLAQEQEAVQQALKEAFEALNIKTPLPFSKESSLATLDMKDLPLQDFVKIWEKSLAIWLTALLNRETSSAPLLSLFGATYTKLPKLYRKEVRRQILTAFSDKLPLLQDFYWEEGYVFSAQSKRHLWLKRLHQSIEKEEDTTTPGSLVAGLYTTKGYFNRTIEGELFEGGQTFKKTVAWGNRLVNQSQGSFFKKNPESPGDEYAVFLLNHLITGQGSPPVELLGVVNKQPHLLLASQAIKGEPLHIFLSNHPEALSKIDKKQFSQMVLMALLIDPEDGKADNYIAQYTQNDQGEITNVQIIGVDNDHVFVKPFIQKGLIFQDTQLFIKTILFCFDEMKESLHPEVVSSYLQLDVTAVLEEWLEALCDYNKRVESLLDKKTLNDYWKGEILIPFFMHPDQVLYLQEKMIRLQQALKQPDKVKTHLDLLKLLNPRLAATYAPFFDQLSSPLQRFELITKDAYKRVRGTTLTMTTTSQIKQHTFRDPLKSVEEFKEKGFTPEESLKILFRLADHKRYKEMTDKSIDSLQEDLKKILTTPLQEELLEKQDWSRVSSTDLSTHLGKFAKTPLRRINLSHCKALTDLQLIRFIEGCRHPITEEIEVQILNLQNCTSLTSKSLDAIKKCKLLKRLNLEGTNLEKLELDKSLISLTFLHLKDCKKLTFIEVEGPLKRLSVQGCIQLQKLYLYCPKLKDLLAQGVPSSLNYWASKETPLSEALFSLIDKAKTEENFELDGPTSQASIDVFIQFFQRNISLKKLVINITKNSNAWLLPPGKIDLRGQPTIEDLYLDLPSLKELHLENMPSLKKVKIGNGITLNAIPVMMQALSKVKNLLELDLSGCMAENLSSLKELHLENMPSLKKVKIGNGIALNAIPVMVQALSKVRNVVELDLSGCTACHENDVELLFGCSQLSRLTMSSYLIDYQNTSGENFLHFAVKMGNKRLIPELVSQGVRLTVKDIFGRTPLQLAISKEDEQIRSLLAKAHRKKIEEIAFGKKDWERYFGSVENEPSLPENILEVLEAPCLIWPEKKLGDTHFLTLIPQTVNKNLLTLNYLEELIQFPKGGGIPAKYDFYDDLVKETHGSQPVDSSYWILLTKDVLPSTKSGMNHWRSYGSVLPYWTEQSKAFKEAGYRLPKAIEVAVSISMEYARSGKLFEYCRIPMCCQEKGQFDFGEIAFFAKETSNEKPPVVVGVPYLELRSRDPVAVIGIERCPCLDSGKYLAGVGVAREIPCA